MTLVYLFKPGETYKKGYATSHNYLYTQFI